MYQCKILADSIGPTNHRLTTFEITYPRFVHSEFLTHRMISRNSASSRAIPISRMIDRVSTDPVTPIHWGANQPGMQARREMDSYGIKSTHAAWVSAMSQSIGHARLMESYGAHKQIVNRLLEPFSWITTIATATEWANFFALRCHPDAQPELQHIAMMMRDAYQSSTPARLFAGDWHMPYIGPDDIDTPSPQEVSAGRCARVSYLTHDGRRDPSKDIELCRQLVTSGHMSPLEHVARAMSPSEWFEHADKSEAMWRLHGVPVGNLRGWLQMRKTVAGEHSFSG